MFVLTTDGKAHTPRALAASFLVLMGALVAVGAAAQTDGASDAALSGPDEPAWKKPMRAAGVAPVSAPLPVLVPVPAPLLATVQAQVTQPAPEEAPIALSPKLNTALPREATRPAATATTVPDASAALDRPRLALPMLTPSAASGTGAFLSVAQAEAIALQRFPDLEVTRQKSVAAEAYASTAAMMSAPVLKFSTSDTVADANSPTTNRKATVGVEWSPPRPGEVQLRREVAESRRDEAKWAHALAQDRLVAEVRATITSLGTLSEMISLSEISAALRSNQVDAAREQYHAKRRTLTELQSLEMQAAEIGPKHEKLVRERALLSARLDGLLGEGADLGRRIAPIPLLQALPPSELESDQLVNTALGTRKEFKALGARCAGVVADTGLRESGNRPWLRDVQISYTPPQDSRQAAVGVQLAVLLPGAGPAHGAPAVMVAERAACVAEQAALTNQIRQEVTQLQHQYRSQRRDVMHTLTDILPLHEQAVSSVQEALKAGRLDAVTVLGIELRQIQAIQAALRQQLDLRALEIRLAHAVGKL